MSKVQLSNLIPKYQRYVENFLSSKKDIDDYRRFRNACQRILNEMNKNNLDVKGDFYKKVYNDFIMSDKKVKEDVKVFN